MAGMETGRNDPCPCGSGKKFKKCCLLHGSEGEPAASGEAEAIRRIEERLDPEILRFAAERYGKDLGVPAWEEFALGNEGIDPEGPEKEHFVPWLLYEYRPGKSGKGRRRAAPGPTLAEMFLESRGDGLSEEERRVLRAVYQEPWSFYDVLEVEPGVRMRLRDALRGAEHEEQMVAREDLNGDTVTDLVFVPDVCDYSLAHDVCIFDGSRRQLIVRRSLARRLEGSSESATSAFHADLVRILRGPEERPLSILVEAGHPDSSLGYLLSLGLTGEELGVYWLWGHAQTVVIEADVTGDGRPEVFVPVRSDDPGAFGSMLLVFDPMRIEGFAPHPAGADWFPEVAGPGSQIACILFPQTELTPPPNKSYIMEIVRRPDDERFRVAVKENIEKPSIWGMLWYWLDQDLRVVEVKVPDSFLKAHWEARRAGIVATDLDERNVEAYEKALLRKVRYCDGDRWVAAPLAPAPR